MEQAPHERDDPELLIPETGTEFDELPGATVDGGAEPHGVADADELLLSQIEDRNEEPGLDVETGVEGGIDPAALVDADEAYPADDDGPAVSTDDSPLGAEFGGDEDGLLQDSEGDAELYQADFSDDESDSHLDDGGLEGTEGAHGADDPLHDGFDDDALPPLSAEQEGEDTQELESDFMREIVLDT